MKNHIKQVIFTSKSLDKISNEKILCVFINVKFDENIESINVLKLNNTIIRNSPK